MVVNSVNFLILVLFFYGRSLAKKDAIKHSRYMMITMSADFALLLYLTIFREALSRVGTSMPPLLIFHILLAVATVVTYVLAVINGRKLLAGEKGVRNRMKIIDRIAVPCRTLVFVTSVMLYLSKAPAG